MNRLTRALGRPASDRRRVEVRLPPDFPHDVERPLRELLAARADQLGLSAAPAVFVSETWRPAPTVSVDGRPLLVADANDDLVGEVDRALLRRLSLLADTVPAFGYLLDHGVSIARAADAPEANRRQDGMSAAEQGELLLERLAPHDLELHVGSAVLRRATSADALVDERTALFADRGVQFPDVRLKPVDDGTPGLLRLNHVRLPGLPLDPDAGWSEAAAALRRSVEEHAHWFVRMGDVVTALGRLSYLGPDLVAMATDRYPAPLLTACLRELVRNGESIRNLPRILWLLLEMGGGSSGSDRVRLSEAPLPGSGSEIERDPVILAAGIRMAVAEERWRVGHAERFEGSRLPLGVEQALVSGEDRVGAEWTALDAVLSAGPPRSIVTRTTAALRPVREVLQALPKPPRVVASQELPADVGLPVI